MAKETETKFYVEDPDLLRAKLAGIGARLISRELEKDVYYSGPAGAQVTTIRLRVTDKKAVFTIKSQPEAALSPSAKLKVLEEYQVEVADAAVFSRMMGFLGYGPQLRKEKIRETYDWRGLVICLDELPYLGYYLEIEAPEDGITSAAEALALDMTKAVADTYMQIFNRYKAASRRSDLELVFPPR